MLVSAKTAYLVFNAVPLISLASGIGGAVLVTRDACKAPKQTNWPGVVLLALGVLAELAVALIQIASLRL